MKNKIFDCVEMKRKGAEAVYQKVAALSVEQQLEYWRQGSARLREQMQERYCLPAVSYCLIHIDDTGR
jgi:hypothetical protein